MDGEDTKLEQALSKARKVLWDLENKRNQRRQDLWLQVTELEDRLEAQLREEFDAEHAALNAIVVDAQAAVDQDLIEKNSKLTGHKAPGTRYWKWHKPPFGEGYRDTKERGVIEVITSESILPGNMAYYSRPRPGSLVLRLLKKDGTPSTRVVVASMDGRFYSGGRWLPEGIRPKEIMR